MTDNLQEQEYRVLARKYRPQTFNDLVGQEVLVQTLTNSITKNRIAHAYLLTGVRGIGKTTTARLIAMSLNCENRAKDSCEPCSRCSSCTSIRKDHNLDVIEMDAASKTGVDDIREIIDNVKYKPTSSQYKIFIIDEVHMLSKNAFNALLKTLEEPPAHIKFIFATTEVKKIPITIISRCQRFDLHRINNNKLTMHLSNISDKEKIKINLDAINLIVRSADGSVRDGLSLLDQAIANQPNHITIESIIQMLGLADRGNIFELIDAILEGNASKALEIYNRIHKSGADILMIFDEMLNIIHFITQIKISPELKDDIKIAESDRKIGFEISEKISMNFLGIIWQILFKGYEELQSGYHSFQHGEMIIIRLIYLYNGPNKDDPIIKNRSSNSKDNLLENKNFLSRKDIQKPILNKLLEKNQIFQKSDENIQNEKILREVQVKSFRQFVDLFYLRREGMLHAYLYNNTKLISFQVGQIVININSIADPHFTRTIAKLVSTWTNRIWKVTSSTSNVGKTLYEEDLIQQQIEIEKMKNDPAIKNILDNFINVKIHSITKINEVNIEHENLIEIKK